MEQSDKSVYKSVLKATTGLGSAALFRLGMEMIRRKFVAVLLGPQGVGLMETFLNIEGMVGTISQSGIPTSGVRQIAFALGNMGEQYLSKQIKIVRITLAMLGALGCIVLFCFAKKISCITFGDDSYCLAIRLLGICVVLINLSASQSCVIQGCRKVRSLALMTIVGAINGTILSIPLFYVWGTKGILPSIILVALASLLTNIYFVRKISIVPSVVSLKEYFAGAVQLIKLGMPIMLSGLASSVAVYIGRVILIRRFGISGVGYWSAAHVLSGGLVSFLIATLTSDFYPRVSEVASDKAAISKTMNVQTEIVLLFALPAIVATSLFAKIGLYVFYDGSFMPTLPILKWSVCGVLFRLACWPMGYVLLAQGKTIFFFLTEVVSNFSFVILVYIFSDVYGLTGTGVAFLVNYIFYSMIMLFVMRINGIKAWNRRILLFLLVNVVFLVIANLVNCIHQSIVQYTVGSSMLVVVSVLSLALLQRLCGFDFMQIAKKFLPFSK